ncbi:hypothetical protein T484DRAFT_1847708 [Baffinella frigidus]|nr:hypothetical protein T484DRAFT_1847708 [Cryptophyta sp. CCMP2293]
MSWTFLPALLTPRCSLAAACVGTLLFALGGCGPSLAAACVGTLLFASTDVPLHPTSLAL